MRILTLVMPAPDSAAAITAVPNGSGIDATRLELVCTPFDELAVEQGLRRRPFPNEER